jgi:hypothetical protein
MTKTKEPNPPFPVEIIDVVPTEVANPFTKQKATLQPTAIAVYDCIKGAEMLEDFDIVEKGLDWFRELSKRIYGVIRLMTNIKAIGISFLDGMLFGAYTVGPVMVFLWAIGFISINI